MGLEDSVLCLPAWNVDQLYQNGFIIDTAYSVADGVLKMVASNDDLYTLKTYAGFHLFLDHMSGLMHATVGHFMCGEICLSLSGKVPE